MKILGVMSGYTGPDRTFLVEFNDEHGDLVCRATRKGDVTTLVIYQHLTEPEIEFLVRTLET